LEHNLIGTGKRYWKIGP